MCSSVVSAQKQQVLEAFEEAWKKSIENVLENPLVPGRFVGEVEISETNPIREIRLFDCLTNSGKQMAYRFYHVRVNENGTPSGTLKVSAFCPSDKHDLETLAKFREDCLKTIDEVFSRETPKITQEEFFAEFAKKAAIANYVWENQYKFLNLNEFLEAIKRIELHLKRFASCKLFIEPNLELIFTLQDFIKTFHESQNEFHEDSTFKLMQIARELAGDKQGEFDPKGDYEKWELEVIEKPNFVPSMFSVVINGKEDDSYKKDLLFVKKFLIFERARVAQILWWNHLEHEELKLFLGNETVKTFVEIYQRFNDSFVRALNNLDGFLYVVLRDIVVGLDGKMPKEVRPDDMQTPDGRKRIVDRVAAGLGIRGIYSDYQGVEEKVYPGQIKKTVVLRNSEFRDENFDVMKWIHKFEDEVHLFVKKGDFIWALGDLENGVTHNFNICLVKGEK